MIFQRSVPAWQGGGPEVGEEGKELLLLLGQLQHGLPQLLVRLLLGVGLA